MCSTWNIKSATKMKISGKIFDLEKNSVFKGEITISGGIIQAVTECEIADEVYIMPGLTDAHVHIESSMVTPSHFAVAAVKHGTVAVVSDPHEIANVLGKRGVIFMTVDAQKVPLKFCFGAPSCVPATTFETAGEKLTISDIRELLENGKVKFLAEMMNFPGVIFDDPEVTGKIDEARRRGINIDGHAPGLRGKELVKYVQAGISTDHECSDLDEALEKIGLGMKILIREGSAAKNLNALAPLVKSNPESIMLCTDDTHPETLEKGHINKLVARLINEGYNMFDVLRAATVNPERHYKLNVGLLRPGDPADFIVVDEPCKMNVLQTWIDGKKVFDGEKALFSPGEVQKVNSFNASRIHAADIRVSRKGDTIRVIKATDGELLTTTELAPAGGENYVEARTSDDILKIVVKDRYKDSPPATAFITGFGLKKGAFAASVAHDSHNIIAVGTNDRDIVAAMNMIIGAGGGMAVVAGEVEEMLKLPVAGLMSDMPVAAMAASYERLNEQVKTLGCKMSSPFMTLSFMALLVIPELKLSDRGLFDGKLFKPVDLFI